MGHKVTQRILVCGDCHNTPADGAPMWEMCGEHICEDCIDKEDETDTDTTT